MENLNTNGETKPFVKTIKNIQHIIDNMVVVLHNIKEGKEIFGSEIIDAKETIEIGLRLKGVALSLSHLWRDDPVSVVIALWNFFLLIQMILKVTMKLVSKIKFDKLISLLKFTKKS